MQDYSGKVAVVTGAASGIGQATARLLATRGAQVVAADYSAEAGQHTADEIRKQGGDATFVQVDVADANAVEALFSAVDDANGRLDALVNCAGIATSQMPVADYPVADWQHGIAVNLHGTFYCMKYAIPLMLKSSGGAIVNLSSVMGSVATPTGAAYSASKHAVMGLTKAAAQDYASQGIRINAVAPGIIETPMTARHLAIDEAKRALLTATPVGRFGQPEEVAALIAFLCSDEALYINGSYHPIDGGFLTH
jgi:NAD(P)-dependent dehydrogenase (short-subunit alcohol dehydrogenase family)